MDMGLSSFVYAIPIPPPIFNSVSSTLYFSFTCLNCSSKISVESAKGSISNICEPMWE